MTEATGHNNGVGGALVMGYGRKSAPRTGPVARPPTWHTEPHTQAAEGGRLRVRQKHSATSLRAAPAGTVVARTRV